MRSVCSDAVVSLLACLDLPLDFLDEWVFGRIAARLQQLFSFSHQSVPFTGRLASVWPRKLHAMVDVLGSEILLGRLHLSCKVVKVDRLVSLDPA
jgi:hypothetical protein